eukprot:9334536-Karenia_brevis.AAC.1
MLRIDTCACEGAVDVKKRPLGEEDYGRKGSVAKKTGGRWAIAETVERTCHGLHLVDGDGHYTSLSS